MKATATSDIDSGALLELRDELGGAIDIEIDQNAILLRSAEPPSWVQFFADAGWWSKILGVYAAIYAAEIFKEAGKETWKERAKLISGTLAAGNKVLKLARALVKFRTRISPRSRLELGLPIPDDYFGIRFELLGRDESIVASEIALFVQYLPLIENLVETQELRSGKVTGAINVLLNDDLSLTVAWMDHKSLRIKECTLRLDDLN